ncbi:class I SAM-dependent methyltransferase [Sphingomonas sp.]|jgi:SAM-dependent methyltransferase|uniref:class I SAM-dependent methyltransferase n=1 Tax=Sphingomonas sp. TaxID=28214 RepID=UPI002DF417AF|nr:class I SAM-dependent methyltransferase [Sphingomonas sp.]
MIDPRLKRHPLGFLHVAEPPTAEELSAYYAQTYYQQEKALYRKSYPDEELAYFRAKTEQHAALAGRLRQEEEGGSFLDVGCGEGFAMRWFSDHGWSVDGIDFSSAGLAQMNPDLLAKAEAGDVFQLLEQRIESGRRYDIVWLKHVLEHVIDPIGLLSSLKRLVAETGVLVVTVPNDGSEYQEHLLERGAIDERFWIALPDHLSYFRRESLENAARSVGWEVKDVLADFPIDFFLLHDGSNYVRDRAQGPSAHRARIQLELLLAAKPADEVNQFYRSMARVGLGRNIIAFLMHREDRVTQ